MSNILKFLFTYRKTNPALGLLLARIALGIVFIMHGYDKLFVAGIDSTTAFFERISIPLPYYNALLVSNLEFFGGILLILGLFTRPLAFIFALDMLVAGLTVHWQNGFWVRGGNSGYEYVMVLMIVSFTLFTAGPGAISLDRLWFRSKPNPVPSQPYE